MDAKKTNLTPELKEIYDRVMNTKGTPVGGNGALPTTPPPVATSLQTQMPQTADATQMPSLGTPPAMPAAPVMAQPAQAAQMPAAPNFGAQPLGTNAEQALSSTPARPISEGNTFAFNGGSVKPAPGPSTQTAEGAKKKAKISLPILIVLGVVFIVVWGVFWAIVLGLIQR